MFYLVQFGLAAGEGERESHGKLLVLDLLFVHKVPETFGDMVKELQTE